MGFLPEIVDFAGSAESAETAATGSTAFAGAAGADGPAEAAADVEAMGAAFVASAATAPRGSVEPLSSASHLRIHNCRGAFAVGDARNDASRAALAAAKSPM
mmetsp:Transcript_30919/g.86338  ORF Transcript_30919/g.86338 Transcript_30919/m.86338 type:complete len:102 (+) Transcript_30919:832-1137(+)